jgi:putative tryptophan/tyrosine transport system substrate-binding protein
LNEPSQFHAARRGVSALKRRDFIMLLSGAAAWPLAVRAARRADAALGIMMSYPKGDPEIEARLRAFRQEFAKLGWTEGANVEFDERWTADDMDRVRSEAAQSGEVESGRLGWATSLARPGGNLTGFTGFELSIFGKSLALLKQIAPTIMRDEKAGDLPFQQPTKYQFIVNLKTAKAMGLDLSPTLVALADEVIE